MMIEQKDYHTTYTLEVESHYYDLANAKHKSDAIMFVMGQESGKAKEVDALVLSSVEEARKFAKSILDLCDEIENR